jgi:hypothetical protein
MGWRAWGECYPWPIAGLHSRGEFFSSASYLSVVLTCLTGLAGIFLWSGLAGQAVQPCIPSVRNVLETL